jgi:inner membrane protein
MEATNEISSKWGGEQRIVGPILTVPYYTFDLSKDQKRENVVRRLAYFLPDELMVNGEMIPEVRYRGIFQVAVYSTNLKLEGFFKAPTIDVSESNMEIDWKGAFITLGISDLLGINKSMDFKWNNNQMVCEPGSSISGIVKSGVSVSKVMLIPPTNENFTFSVDLSLNGSRSLNFAPVGKETQVKLSSTWSNPSFEGAFLPASREISEDGFDATWKVLELNRNYPQRWFNRDVNLDDSAFGVSLILPVETYQITERSMKYAILFFALTFIVFFFVEILKKLRVHPIQYILVGFGLTLFYLLLLSLSEHLGFGLAYIIASVGIIVMITSYSSSVFRNRKLTAMMGGFLAILYGFLYVLLQLQDFTLLMGSLGLFIILSLVMYLSRKVDWYAIGSNNGSGDNE